MTVRVTVRVEMYDGDSLKGSATRDDVDLLSMPAAGDTFGAMVLHPSHEPSPPVDHVEHYPLPTWRESEPASTRMKTPPEAVVVVRTSWTDPQVLLEYDLHGWRVQTYSPRP